MNTRSLMGLGLLILSVFILFGGLGWASAWVAGYWDKEYVETYRGYDIYYFINIHVYGWQDSEGHWHFHGTLESAEAGIDDYLDQPIYIENYKGYDIYQTPGSGFYYAVNPYNNETVGTYWTDLEDLKAWIDSQGPPQPPETLEAEVKGLVYTSPGEVEVESPEGHLSWLRWLGLPLMALGAVLVMGREEK